MTAVASTYSADELAVLQKFRQICENIAGCRFIRDLPKQEHKFTVENLPDGTSRCSYPHYDNDDFLAFLTHFRKLVAEQEPTNIFRMLNLIGRKATEDERKVLKGYRKAIVAEGTNPPLQLAIVTPGNETSYTPKQIEDIIFNGQVFHADDALQADLRRILDFHPLTRMAFLRYASVLYQHASLISSVLKNQGHVQ